MKGLIEALSVGHVTGMAPMFIVQILYSCL